MNASAKNLRQLSTFASVGVAATLTHLAAAWVAHSLGAAPHLANLSGWFVAMLVSLMGRARLTFRIDAALSGYFPRFLMFSALAYLVSALVVTITTRLGLPFAYSLVVIGLTVPPTSYLAQRYMVFDQSRESGWDLGHLIAIATSTVIYFAFRDAYVNHDVAWYLVAGRQWIEGAQLYSDLSEVNPPLAFYLIRAALHFGDLFGLDPAASLSAYVALLTGLSLAWTVQIVPKDLAYRPAFLTVIAAATTLPFFGHFGQREHFMLLLILPWVASALFDDRPFHGKGAVLRGLIAGIGICLKPHFLIYPAMLALFEVLRHQSLRPILSPGNLAMGSVGLAYVLGVIAFHPEYFSIIVPDARLVYGAYTLPFVYVIENLRPWHVVLTGMTLALGYRAAGVGGARALTLFVAGLGAYALQGNGFTYHVAPAHALALIGLALMAVTSLPGIALAATAMIAAYTYAFVEDGGYRNPLSSNLETHLAVADIQPERLLVWSPSLLPAFPLVLETGAEWSGHAASLWLLPGTLDLVEEGGSEDDPRQAVLTRSRGQMARDLAACPDVLIIDRVLPFRAKPLDILTYAGPKTATEVTENYGLIEQTPRFDIRVRKHPCP